MPDQPAPPDPVVLVAAAGTGRHPTVSWYRTVRDAETHRAVLTATPAGVVVGGFLTDLPGEWVDAAVRAYQLLAADSAADLTAWATHRHTGPPNGPLTAVSG